MKELWECWSLTKADIDETARDMGISPLALTAVDYEVIAQTFIATLHRENQDWRGSIVETINDIVAAKASRRHSQHGQAPSPASRATQEGGLAEAQDGEAKEVGA